MEYPVIKLEEECLCRLCGQMQENVMSLCGEGSEDSVTLIARILRYLNIKFTANDALPKWLCATCYLNAKTTHNFLLLVEEGQRKLCDGMPRFNETSAGMLTEKTASRQNIKLESDCPQSSGDLSENILNHEFFEIKEIEEAPTSDTQTSVYDRNTTHLKTEEDYAIVEYKPPQQQQFCTSDNNLLSYQCHICGENYKDEYLLTAHMANHIFKCNRCTRSFANENELALHMCRRTKVKSFATEQYPDTTASNSYQLAQNSEFHVSPPNVTTSQDLPFKCFTCFKSFKKKYFLNRHLLVHTGEKPFSCTICRKKYTRKAYLKVHYTLIHPNNT